MLSDYKRQLIFREIRDAPEDFIEELFERLKTNTHFRKIYDEDYNRAAKEYFDAVNAETIKYTAFAKKERL